MRTTEILIVDDSVVFRKVLFSALSKLERTRVAIASNGHQALARIRSRRPDAVVLDVIMPGMDGLETLREIRKLDDTLPVIMFSSKTQHAAKITVEALTSGANDYVPKPNGLKTDDVVIQQELIPRLQALLSRPRSSRSSSARSRSAPRAPASPPPPPVSILSQKTPSRSRAYQMLTIGVSTGGPQALEVVLSRLPADLPVPILIAQHMPPDFTAYLAAQLDRVSPLRVREGFDGAMPQPGDVWIAPGGRHMTISRRTIRLLDTPPVNACRPSVDVLFESVARCYPGAALAVMLTGMGSDGTDGARAIKHSGGRILVQDEESSVVWGMPRSVYEAGLSDAILPLDEIPGAIHDILLFSAPLARKYAQ